MENKDQVKVAELKRFFESRKPGISVCTDRDSDLRAASFRFDPDEAHVVSRLLYISADVLDDHSIDKIIEGLKSRRWEEVLESVPEGTKIIYTSKGFQTVR